MKDIKIGSIWQNENGNKYKVTALVNTRSNSPDEFPITVVYEDIVSGVSSYKRLRNWHKSMTEFNPDDIKWVG